MVKIVIKHRTAYEIMNIVHNLRSNGLVQHCDFDFEYHREEINDGEILPRHTVFTFYKEKHATLFALKYSSN